jgi:endoglucanase
MPAARRTPPARRPTGGLHPRVLVPLALAGVLSGVGVYRTVLVEPPPETEALVGLRSAADMPASRAQILGGEVGRLAAPTARAAPGGVPPHPAGSAPARPSPPTRRPPALEPRPGPGNPFRGARLFVDPAGAAARAAEALSAAPADAASLARIASQPHADWFGDGVSPAAIENVVAARVAEVRAAGTLPVLVAYAIPNRDCGGYSAGGLDGPDAYRAWIAAFAAGIGAGPAAVILEPDALAQADCLPPDQADARYALLADAVDVLAGAGASVYIDAGNSRWRPVADVADRLRRAGVARARGFALNVSNFQDTAGELAFGEAVSAALGGQAHFVVDTSRNGAGPASDGQWCNPAGRALGAPPSADTGSAHADAFLWVKPPGESDGTCNGGPPAGEWWLDYALGLARRAG